MVDLKLAKLPDRTPVKITFVVSPDLHRTLQVYADVYAETYGSSEAISELIPPILQSFLDGDREFARSRGRDDRKKR